MEEREGGWWGDKPLCMELAELADETETKLGF